LCLCGCSTAEAVSEEFDPTGMIEVFRSYSPASGYSHVFYDGQKFYNSFGDEVADSDDFDTNKIIAVHIASKPAEQYAYYRGTKIPDPTSLRLSSIKLYMPYNYKADLDSSNVYLATCLSLGYKLQSLKQSSMRAEILLSNGEDDFRVVVYNSILKIYGKNMENQDWR